MIFAVFILFACLCFDLRIFGHELVIGGGISAGYRLDDSTIRIIECRIWRRDYRRISLFTPRPPIPGETWGCAWIYIVDDDRVKFSWEVYSRSDVVVIELKDNVSHHTVHLHPSGKNTIFYTDAMGNLREYVLSVMDTDINDFIAQAMMLPKNESDYYKFWEILQAKNTESKIIYPVSLSSE